VYSNLTFFARFPGASEYHDGQVNVLSCLPDWQVALSKKWPSLMFSMSDKFFIVHVLGSNFVFCEPS
jgi:hypothetical protein